MIKEVEIKVRPALVNDEKTIRREAIKKSGLPASKVEDVRVLRRSIDARGAKPWFRLRTAVYSEEPFVEEPALLDNFQDVSEHDRVIVVGAGPAGYFAALELIELGLKPIVLDRGKDVRSRRRDLRAIQQFGEVDPHSNYCFGEGGAGTYSDGKLYTRSHKRGSIIKALRLLVEHGANPEILQDAHPHIGSNKLPGVVANIRQTILHFGGEVHFESHVTDFLLSDGSIKGVVVNENQEFKADAVILATGHSARDIYRLLARKAIKIEAKPFALGVRIEHPQSLIDEIQYNQPVREPNLPAASYKLVCQVEERGV
ncbi:MAG: FAD-binding protein, partial [Bacteroidetes bacterium]